MSDSVWVDAQNCDRRLFRDMLGSFMTGVTVVAAQDAQGAPCAFTANSFTSVSLDPPLILVCLAKSAASADVFRHVERFSVNILGDWQRNLSAAFASRSPAKAAALNALMQANPPVLDGSLANMICTRRQVVDAGDHIILIGGVSEFRIMAGQPLGYFRGGYIGFGLAVRSLEQLAVPLHVGGLLEQDGRVVLCRRAGASYWQVPIAPLQAAEQHSTLIGKVFARLGISARSSFLYSVFQEEGESHTTMVFSTEAAAAFTCGVLEDGTRTASFGVEDEPWTLVKGTMMQGMVQRFFRERAAGCFGIYCDTADGGSIAPIGSKLRHWTEWHPEEAAPVSTAACG